VATPPSLREKVLDTADSALQTSMSVLTYLGYGVVIFVATCGLVEGTFRLVVEPELFEVIPKWGEHLGIEIHDHPFDDAHVALVLYNGSAGSHSAFLRDAVTANQKHTVTLAALDCARYESACTANSLQVLHEHRNKVDWQTVNWSSLPMLPEEIVLGDEPEVLFYTHALATDSYQEGLADGTVRSPAGRAERVAALLTWLDVAASRAEHHAKSLKAAREKVSHKEGAAFQNLNRDYAKMRDGGGVEMDDAASAGAHAGVGGMGAMMAQAYAKMGAMGGMGASGMRGMAGAAAASFAEMAGSAEDGAEDGAGRSL
jgi:hypothetical protein